MNFLMMAIAILSVCYLIIGVVIAVANDLAISVCDEHVSHAEFVEMVILWPMLPLAYFMDKVEQWRRS